MQARTHWTRPGGVLGRLCEEAAERALSLERRLRELRRAAIDRAPPASLVSALAQGDYVHVIAEIKRRSPSKGTIDDRLDAGARAREYAEGGASAISVLTEAAAFGGSNDDLAAVRDALHLPILKKDFHIRPSQVWEARALGASALLLIVRALGPDNTARLADVAGEAEIEALFEIRDEWELELALEQGAVLVGVNRRNLETLELDDQLPGRLLPRIPLACVAVAESGIADRQGVIEAAEAGADAVLIGSSLSASADAVQTVRSLRSVPREGRRA